MKSFSGGVANFVLVVCNNFLYQSHTKKCRNLKYFLRKQIYRKTGKLLCRGAKWEEQTMMGTAARFLFSKKQTCFYFQLKRKQTLLYDLCRKYSVLKI